MKVESEYRWPVVASVKITSLPEKHKDNTQCAFVTDLFHAELSRERY